MKRLALRTYNRGWGGFINDVEWMLETTTTTTTTTTTVLVQLELRLPKKKPGFGFHARALAVKEEIAGE